MKITFPHLGYAYVPLGLFFNEIGVEAVMPPKNSAKLMEKGSKYAPEEICIPFKLMIAQLMESKGKGADTVIMPATLGPCRLGEYAELLKSVLDANGYHYEWIVLDTVNVIGIKELAKRLSKIISTRQKGNRTLIYALRGAYKIMKGLDELEKTAYQNAAYAKDKKAHQKVLEHARVSLEGAASIREGIKIIFQAKSQMARLEIDRQKNPLKIIVTGEFFSLIEPFASHYLPDRLMDMGVSFEKRMYVSWWIKKIVMNPFYLRYMNGKKNKYLECNVGGYAKESVEDGLLCKKKEKDGMIQIFPTGCMPEIVSKSSFEIMSEELDIKMLTLIFDEMDGQAGYITRLEAFIDMLVMQRRKKERKQVGRANVLSWD